MPLNIDPLFSERIRTFEKYAERKKMSTDELYRLYDNNEPIYFHIQNYAEVNAELRQFVESEEFPKFIAQLEKCFAMINEFVITNDIKVNTRSAVPMSGAQIVEISAKVALDKFLNKLKTDYFADRRAILYDGGKKYLEELSMLLSQPNINLEDRKIQLRTLVDDDALEYCADGCFSRLQSTVENLKDNLDVNVDRWMEKFIKNQLNEVLQKPELLSGKTPAQKLALILNQSIENNEIHLNNWFNEKLKAALQLCFIEIPNDSYVQATDRYLTNDQASQQQANIELEQVKRNFLNSLTASKFVEFIVSDIYHNFSSTLEYMQLVDKVENTLKVFGLDESFRLSEIFDPNTFKLKLHLQVFYKTIVLRLLESGFFNKDQVILDETSSNKYQFKFFKKNLLLHLIKQIHSEEPIFSNLLEAINQPQHLKEIYDSIDIHQRNNFFNELIQTPQDFIIFLNNIDPHTLDYFNNDLLKVFENLKTSYSLYFPDQSEIDTSKYSLLTSTFEIIYSILSRLKGGIGQPETIKDFFYNKIIQKNEFKKALNNYIISTINRIINYNTMTDHSILSAYELINSEIQLVLYNLFDMGMKNFSHIKFHGEYLNYLNNINCRGCDFSHAIFNVELDHCVFNEANLNNIIIELESEITNSEFRRADLTDANIYGKVFLCSFNESKISNTIFNQIKNSDFSGTILDKVKFNKLFAVDFIGSQIRNTLLYNVKDSDFSRAILDRVEFKELFFVNLQESEISNANFYGESTSILFLKANIKKQILIRF